tara:strand:+ start:1690 stop:1935 length:246 start_codon:yes stop_codon:yes gene_type:complete
MKKTIIMSLFFFSIASFSSLKAGPGNPSVDLDKERHEEILKVLLEIRDLLQENKNLVTKSHVSDSVFAKEKNRFEGNPSKE